ncbi:MAG: hypothetical protein E7326_00690 [Clostridiales bacterium]|nr:hypothetical protein [Clostridiales bacterium]
MGKKTAQLPRDVQALLQMARTEADPVLRERCLLLAEELDGDSLPVQRALLMLGNLARRDPGRIDLSVIKCYLLHVFEHPEMHGEAESKRMTEEIFHHERLQRCLLLAQDKDAFLRDYLAEMCREYLHIFIEGQREHVGGWLGFQTAGKRLKGLSAPCADMILNMMLSPFLTEEEGTCLTGVFYRECLSFLGSSVYLDARLPNEIRERIR